MLAVLQPANVRQSAAEVYFLHRIEDVVDGELLVLRDQR